MKPINWRITGLFVFIILTWGLSWPINKVGLNYLSPLWYATARLVIGTVTMMLIVFVTGKLTLPKREDMPLILIIGLLQISLYILLANLGLAYLPAGRASLLAYTTPLWIVPSATLFFHEETSPMRWIGFILGMGGLLLLLSPADLDWEQPHVLFGSAMLLLASLSWAISMLCARYMHWSKSPLELIPWQLLIATLPVLVCALVLEPTPHVQWTNELIISLFYTGVIVTGISYWCGLIVNKELPTTIVSLGFLTVPALSLATSSLFMHESITMATTLALAMILAGLACVVL